MERKLTHEKQTIRQWSLPMMEGEAPLIEREPLMNFRMPFCPDTMWYRNGKAKIANGPTFPATALPGGGYLALDTVVASV